jgi:hypothetical protein
MSKNEYSLKNVFLKNGYFLFKNIIDKEFANFLYSYLILKKEVFLTFRKIKRISQFNLDWGAEADTMVSSYNIYGDTAMDTLLKILKNKIEKQTTFELNESYSYARLYKKGDFLNKHTDRNSCKISATLNLGGNLWPFYLIDKNNIQIEALLKPGDCLLYQGTEVVHWRNNFEGETCGQVFLHYTLKNEKNKKLYDGRLHLGLPFKDKEND